MKKRANPNMGKGRAIYRFKTGFVLCFLPMAVLLFAGCAGKSVFLVPKEIRSDSSAAGERLDIQIRPIYTSDLQSEDRKIYPVDFSAYFIAIEIRFRNGTGSEAAWDASRAFLSYGNDQKLNLLTEDEAYNYYKYGDRDEKAIVLVDKTYEQQKEEIEGIKRYRMKPAAIPAGGEASGLLFFRKIPRDQCENVRLVLEGIRVNLEERTVQFPLECPKE